jgi:hypothetical protein
VGFLPSHWTSAIDGPSARIATVAGVGPARSLRFPHLFFCDRILDRLVPILQLRRHWLRDLCLCSPIGDELGGARPGFRVEKIHGRLSTFIGHPLDTASAALAELLISDGAP